MQVDHALLAHEKVAEAVAFASPDELLGEAVEAVVVLQRDEASRGSHQELAAEIRSFLSSRISKEKVPCTILPGIYALHAPGDGTMLSCLHSPWPVHETCEQAACQFGYTPELKADVWMYRDHLLPHTMMLLGEQAANGRMFWFDPSLHG